MNDRGASLPDRISRRFRRCRAELLFELLAAAGAGGRPVNVLDVGGTEAFWKAAFNSGARIAASGLAVTLLNLQPQPASLPGFRSVVGDGRDMRQFADASFDAVVSNSVIEHVGGLDDQRRMAGEVRRVGRRLFLQTPNRRFPIEPHFRLPLFQFLPLSWRVRLLGRFALGFYPRTPQRELAERHVRSIRLLTRSELAELFPGATILAERFCGLAKSFMVVSGWS